jgi:hypothetical protein
VLQDVKLIFNGHGKGGPTSTCNNAEAKEIKQLVPNTCWGNETWLFLVYDFSSLSDLFDSSIFLVIVKSASLLCRQSTEDGLYYIFLHTVITTCHICLIFSLQVVTCSLRFHGINRLYLYAASNCHVSWSVYSAESTSLMLTPISTTVLQLKVMCAQQNRIVKGSIIRDNESTMHEARYILQLDCWLMLSCSKLLVSEMYLVWLVFTYWVLSSTVRMKSKYSAQCRLHDACIWCRSSSHISRCPICTLYTTSDARVLRAVVLLWVKYIGGH